MNNLGRADFCKTEGMSWILWILPLVCGLSSRYIGEFKTDFEFSRRHSFNSNITKSKVAQIRPVQSSVNISPFPKVDAQFGQELVLSCIVEDLPPPSFSWLQVRRGEERLRGNSSSLALTSISYADSGQWRCLASNSGGTWRSKPTELRVFGPPASLSAPGTVLGRVGQKLVITAGFCCHPPPSVDWVVAAKTLIEEDSSRIAFSTKPELDSCYSTTLTFNQLTISDSGEVVVEVANSEGGQRRVIIVEVVDEEVEVVTDGRDQAHVEPEVKMEVTGEVEDEDIPPKVQGEQVIPTGESIEKEEKPEKEERMTSKWLGWILAATFITMLCRKVKSFKL